MGSRIEASSNTQPRGNHQSRPFMYVGRVGDGRRFLCPLYKCDEQGEDLTSSVVDEEVVIPGDPLSACGGGTGAGAEGTGTGAARGFCACSIAAISCCRLAIIFSSCWSFCFSCCRSRAWS